MIEMIHNMILKTRSGNIFEKSGREYPKRVMLVVAAISRLEFEGCRGSEKLDDGSKRSTP
jgi:hypothetical protein